jgi:hypothetical protein
MRRCGTFLVALGLMALPHAEAQQKIYRIGVLFPALGPVFQNFRQELNRLIRRSKHRFQVAHHWFRRVLSSGSRTGTCR